MNSVYGRKLRFALCVGFFITFKMAAFCQSTGSPVKNSPLQWQLRALNFGESMTLAQIASSEKKPVLAYVCTPDAPKLDGAIKDLQALADNFCVVIINASTKELKIASSPGLKLFHAELPSSEAMILPRIIVISAGEILIDYKGCSAGIQWLVQPVLMKLNIIKSPMPTPRRPNPRVKYNTISLDRIPLNEWNISGGDLHFEPRNGRNYYFKNTADPECASYAISRNFRNFIYNLVIPNQHNSKFEIRIRDNGKEAYGFHWERNKLYVFGPGMANYYPVILNYAEDYYWHWVANEKHIELWLTPRGLKGRGSTNRVCIWKTDDAQILEGGFSFKVWNRGLAVQSALINETKQN